jgi:CheY-like chemotaxis protein
LADEHDVTFAPGGREALDLLLSHGAAEHTFDLILCDLMMPKMTGMEVWKEVARGAPHLAERFVFVTGGAFTQEARAFLEGAQGGGRGEKRARLEKPFDLNKLRALILERVDR